MGEVKPQDVSDFAISLAQDLSTASAARTIVSVRGFHKFAVAEAWVASDPSVDVHPAGIPRKLPKALPYESVISIIAAAGESKFPQRDTALIELLYGTGMRISELVGLEIDDLDAEATTVLVTGKGNKQRLIPVGGYALNAFAIYLSGERREILTRSRTGGTHKAFLNTRGGPLSRQSAWEIVSSAAERAKIVGVTPHSFRHSYATHLLERGADVRTVQELLGHASVTTTQIYTMVTVDTLREIYAGAHPRAR